MDSKDDRLLLDKIGFNYFISHLEIKSCFGHKRIKKIKSFSSIDDLNNEFNNIELLKKIYEENETIFKQITSNLSKYHDLEPLLINIDIKSLNYIDVFEIKAFTYYTLELLNLIDSIKGLKDLIKLADLYELYNYLDQDKSNTPYFYIYAQYDKELLALRKEKEYSDNETIHAKIIEKENEVLQTISKFILNYLDLIVCNIKAIGYFDILLAKVKIINKYNLKRPLKEDGLLLVDAYSPYFKDILQKDNINIQEIDINLNKSINVLTGSNMSGKSVALKTIAFNIACINYGFYSFTSNSSIRLVDYILLLDDDCDDVRCGLSSFGKEVRILNESLKFIKNKSGILLIDELARGTNPFEARIIIESLAQYLNNKDQFNIISTHLNVDLPFVYNHYKVNGLSELDISKIDETKKISTYMDHRITLVNQDTMISNDAHKVMKLMGFNEDVLKIIENKIEKEKDNGSNKY